MAESSHANNRSPTNFAAIDHLVGHGHDSQPPMSAAHQSPLSAVTETPPGHAPSQTMTTSSQTSSHIAEPVERPLSAAPAHSNVQHVYAAASSSTARNEPLPSESTTTPGQPRQSTPAMRDTPSPSALVDDPLSTEAMPFPPPPAQPTEAEDAFQQVFDTIEAAPEDDTWSDSGYSESIANSGSTSLSSSVRDYEFENGRRYHAYAAGRYLLPNDDAEQEREDLKHSTVLAVCGGNLHFAPLDEHASHQMKVIDLGTGTGIWCVEMGDKYPSADIIGVDLSPHQPQWVPPNVRFEVDDIENEWLWGENAMDMVHARHMSLGIKDWDHVLSSAYRALKPGGWIEFCEFDYWPNSDDGTMTPENRHLYWTYRVTEGLAANGIDLHAALHLRHRVEQAGYKNVVEHVIKVPIGQWAKNQVLKRVGMYMHAVLYDGLQGIAMGPLTRGLGWTKEEVELMLPSVRKDLNDLSIHTYYSLHVVFGQKI